MNIGYDVAAALPELRAQAESLHTDMFTVYRATGASTQDPVTLVEVPVFAVVLSGVRGKLQAGTNQANDVQVVGVKVAESTLYWHTSVGTVGVLTDDVVACTGVGPGGDPELVGRRVRVVGPFLKSHATARRFQVELVT